MLSQTELKELLYGSLKELNLTEQEINVYVVSLSLGPTSLANLADHLNIPRPNIYRPIEGLEKRGLAKFSDRKKFARTFMVEPPTAVTELLKERRETIASFDQKITGAMPDLLALYRQGNLPTNIKILQTKEQWMKAFFQILDEAKEEILFFGSVTDFIEFVSWSEEREWIKIRLRKNLFIKSLLLPSAETETLQKDDVKEFREIRTIQGLSPFPTSFQLFANKVIFWQPKSPLAVLIEDEYIVSMLKEIFHFLWKNSDPNQKKTN